MSVFIKVSFPVPELEGREGSCQLHTIIFPMGCAKWLALVKYPRAPASLGFKSFNVGSSVGIYLSSWSEAEQALRSQILHSSTVLVLTAVALMWIHRYHAQSHNQWSPSTLTWRELETRLYTMSGIFCEDLDTGVPFIAYFTFVYNNSLCSHG